MEFLFKTPAESRRDPLNAINALLTLANRWLAKFISGPYLHRLGDRRQFLKPNIDILREWIAGGRFALAGHLLEVQMKLELDQSDQTAPIAPFLAAKDIAPLCNELAGAC